MREGSYIMSTSSLYRLCPLPFIFILFCSTTSGRGHKLCLAKKRATSVACRSSFRLVFAMETLFYCDRVADGGRYQYVVFVDFTTGAFVSAARANAVECGCD